MQPLWVFCSSGVFLLISGVTAADHLDFQQIVIISHTCLYRGEGSGGPHTLDFSQCRAQYWRNPFADPRAPQSNFFQYKCSFCQRFCQIILDLPLLWNL